MHMHFSINNMYKNYMGIHEKKKQDKSINKGYLKYLRIILFLFTSMNVR